jgi:hypothetical protein
MLHFPLSFPHTLYFPDPPPLTNLPTCQHAAKARLRLLQHPQGQVQWPAAMRALFAASSALHLPPTAPEERPKPLEALVARQDLAASRIVVGAPAGTGTTSIHQWQLSIRI